MKALIGSVPPVLTIRSPEDAETICGQGSAWVDIVKDHAEYMEWWARTYGARLVVTLPATEAEVQP